MNKKLTCLLCILVLTFSIVNTSIAQEKLDDWRFSKDIIVSGNNKYKSIFLDKDVYKYCKDDLEDVRVVDNKGNFIPYYLMDGISNIHQDLVQQRFNITNKFNKNDDTFFDFKEAVSKFGMDNLTNEIKIFLDKTEFLANIVIYGSFDGVNWEYIKDDRIYKIENLENTTIYFSDVKKYTNYRVKVLNNIENINFKYLIGEYDYLRTVQNKYEKVEPIKYDVKHKGKITYITLNNESKLKINNIYLDIDGIFKRDYSIEVRSNSSFKSIEKRGQIYNLEFKDLNVENKRISFRNPIFSDIKIKIYNYDDQPLNIKQVNVKYLINKLVFEGEKNNQYKVYFGNNSANKAIYDIEEYKSHIENENQDECSLDNFITYKENIIDEEIGTKFNFKPIFNGIIVGLSILLTILIGIKFKSKME